MKVNIAGLLVASLALSSVANAQYKLGGPDSSLTPSSGSWSWDGGELSTFRSALENPAYFGPGGVSQTSIVTSNLSSLDAASLAGLDGLILPWMFDADTTPTQETDIMNFFLNGGDLFLLDDDDVTDRIAELLGVPTTGSDGSVSNGSSPLFSGLFGSATDVAQWGDTGQIMASDVTAHNGNIGGMNAGGQVTSAYWEKGQYAPGAGKLLILGDVDMVSIETATYGSSLGDLNSNGIFALNSTDWLVSNPVPEPASMAVLGLGAAALLRRKRKK